MKGIWRILTLAMVLAMIAGLMMLPSNVQPVKAIGANSPSNGSDADGDGLADSDEITIGTDPYNVDSDCDFIDDGTEVGNPASPTDSDGDGVIDALENNLANSDYPADSTKDHLDYSTSVQATCGRFKPFAIANDGADSSRLEVRVTGSGVISVSVEAPAIISPPGIVNLDGAAVTSNQTILLYDDGTHSDQRAGDGVWTRGGFTSTYSIPAGFWADDFEIYKIDVTDGSGKTRINWYDPGAPFVNVNHYIKLGVVKSSEVQTPIAMGSGVQATSNLLNILNPTGSLDPKAAYGSDTRRQAAAHAFYDTMGDDYDFVFLPGRPSARVLRRVLFWRPKRCG